MTKRTPRADRDQEFAAEAEALAQLPQQTQRDLAFAYRMVVSNPRAASGDRAHARAMLRALNLCLANPKQDQ